MVVRGQQAWVLEQNVMIATLKENAPHQPPITVQTTPLNRSKSTQVVKILNFLFSYNLIIERESKG